MTTPLIPNATTPPPASEAQGLRAEQAATKSTARTIAHMIATKMTEGGAEATPLNELTNEGTPPPAREPRYTTDPVETVAKDTVPAATETVPAATTTEPATGEDEGIAVAPDVEELTRIVEEAALDLGVAPNDIPAELLPVFEKVVQASIQVKQQAAARESEAAEAVGQVQEFARQLKEQPDRLLLSMALTQPEVFAKVVETFTEMQNDPRIKDLVSRELAAEARLREAERRERLMGQESVRTRTEKVVNATQIASRKLGVPYELAEQFVAAAITNAQGEFGPADVDGVVAKLAKQIQAKATVRKGAPRVATPAKVAATAAAPTATNEGAGAPPASSENRASAGLKEASPHGRLMDIVRSAGKRLRITQ